MVVRPHVREDLLTFARRNVLLCCCAAMFLPQFAIAWQKPKRLSTLLEEVESNRADKIPSKEPTTWTLPPSHPDVRAASFKGLTPGKSNRDDVQKSLGKQKWSPKTAM